MTPTENAARAVLRNLIVVLGTVGVLWLIWLLRHPISWVILALFLALALSGPINRLSRRMPRKLAIALTYIGLLGVPITIIALITPSVVSGVNELVNEVPGYAEDLQTQVQNSPRLRKLDADYGITKRVNEEAQKLPNRLGPAAGTLTDIGIGIVNSIFAGITILILSIFMVSSGPRWAQGFLERQRPDRAMRMRRAMERTTQAIGAYVGGVIIQATIAGVSTFIVLSILGVPFAAPLAVLTALLDAIPLIGATIGAVLTGIVTLFVDFPTVTIVWVIYALIYQQIENSIIQPRIQARAVNVQPFVVIVSVLFGSTLFGVAGALLAVPLAASLQIAGRELLDYRRDINAAAVAQGAVPAGGASLVDPPPRPNTDPPASGPGGATLLG